LPADLIVYALVAAGLVFWLRSILGTRHSDEPQRPNPLASKVDINIDNMGESHFSADEAPQSAEDKIMDLAANPTWLLSVENKTAENGLLDISKQQPGFDIKFFLDGAQEAFVMVVEAFAKGDRETLKDLLAPPVYSAFDGAIEEREKAGDIQETEIQSIQRVQVIEAKNEGKMALITVKFTAEESSVRRDNSGEIIEGNPDKTTKMVDIWTFGREHKSKSPAWLVMETRGGFEDDNEILPDSH